MFEDRVLSYAALDAHANRLAHHLHSLGVGPETMVGLLVERSPEMVVGLLGILKAGGAYLPLDPNYPRERLAFMLADAGAAVLVTQAGAARPAARGRMRRSWCGSTPTGRRSRASPTPRRRSSSIPRHPAYVIYTSGSTGTPKGVVVEHAQTVANQDAATLGLNLALRPGFRSCISFSSCAFDCSIAGNIWRWSTARRIVVISDDMRVDRDDFGAI